jgi:hypothetical protein
MVQLGYTTKETVKGLFLTVFIIISNLLDVSIRLAGQNEIIDLAKTSIFALEPLNLAEIERIFPFEGKFHFRYKITREEIQKKKGIDISEDFLWIDLTKQSDTIIYFDQETMSIELQATVSRFNLTNQAQFGLKSIYLL